MCEKHLWSYQHVITNHATYGVPFSFPMKLSIQLVDSTEASSHSVGLTRASQEECNLLVPLRSGEGMHLPLDAMFIEIDEEWI